ncbi:hypothetical protein KEM56_001368 [Ascosphaera pollenicola]|nr:hypothetical protein KEM56_001368 [Ascosphaera pollenicola]
MAPITRKQSGKPSGSNPAHADSDIAMSDTNPALMHTTSNPAPANGDINMSAIQDHGDIQPESSATAAAHATQHGSAPTIDKDKGKAPEQIGGATHASADDINWDNAHIEAESDPEFKRILLAHDEARVRKELELQQHHQRMAEQLQAANERIRMYEAAGMRINEDPPFNNSSETAAAMTSFMNEMRRQMKEICTLAERKSDSGSAGSTATPPSTSAHAATVPNRHARVDDSDDKQDLPPAHRRHIAGKQDGAMIPGLSLAASQALRKLRADPNHPASALLSNEVVKLRLKALVSCSHSTLPTWLANDAKRELELICQQPNEYIRPYFGRLQALWRVARTPKDERISKLRASVRNQYSTPVLGRHFASVKELFLALLDIENDIKAQSLKRQRNEPTAKASPPGAPAKFSGKFQNNMNISSRLSGNGNSEDTHIPSAADMEHNKQFRPIAREPAGWRGRFWPPNPHPKRAANANGKSALSLVDNGSRTNVVNEAFVRSMGDAIKPLAKPIKLVNASGVVHAVLTHMASMHFTLEGEHTEILYAYVTKLPYYDIVLGDPWQKRHNVRMDFVLHVVPRGQGSSSSRAEQQTSLM